MRGDAFFRESGLPQQLVSQNCRGICDGGYTDCEGGGGRNFIVTDWDHWRGNTVDFARCIFADIIIGAGIKKRPCNAYNANELKMGRSNDLLSFVDHTRKLKCTCVLSRHTRVAFHVGFVAAWKIKMDGERPAVFILENGDVSAPPPLQGGALPPSCEMLSRIILFKEAKGLARRLDSCNSFGVS